MSAFNSMQTQGGDLNLIRQSRPLTLPRSPLAKSCEFRKSICQRAMSVTSRWFAPCDTGGVQKPMASPIVDEIFCRQNQP